MFKSFFMAGVTAVALSLVALPGTASAQGFGGGPQGMEGSDQFRPHRGGGRGQSGGGEGFRSHGGQGQFGGDEGFRFRGGQGHVGGGFGADRGEAGRFRYGEQHGRFGQEQNFRYGREHRNFGDAEGFRFRHDRERVGYGERFRVGRGLEERRGFGEVNFRHGYRVGVIRRYPAYRHYVREEGFGVGYVRPYAVGVGYGFPGAGCTTRRNVSVTPFGWRKIVTVRTCYVR